MAITDDKTHLLVETQQEHSPGSLHSAFDHETSSELGATWTIKGQGHKNPEYLTAAIDQAWIGRRARLLINLPSSDVLRYITDYCVRGLE